MKRRPEREDQAEWAIPAVVAGQQRISAPDDANVTAHLRANPCPMVRPGIACCHARIGGETVWPPGFGSLGDRCGLNRMITLQD